MFDTSGPVVDAVAVRAAAEEVLSGVDGAGVGDRERVDLLAALETLKRAASAAQARVTAAFVVSQREAAAARGVPVERRGRGVGEQVALARGESPARGSRFVGLSTALVDEMPHTLAALSAGRVDEWAATVLVRESATLSRADRTELDARLVGLLARPGVGVGRLTRAARAVAADLDAAAVARRAAKAASDRRVTIRPAPDTMTYVTALLPVAEGVAVVAALEAAATAATSVPGGDPRGRGQLMADTLVARVTGRDPVTAPVPVAVQLVMTDRTFLAGDDAPASVPGHGPVPAPVARALVAAAAAGGVAWVRRLFVAPKTGDLVGMESRQRKVPRSLAALIRVRDQSCATPWCDAPIRHVDHIRPHRAGGATAVANLQGLCQRCNLVKEVPGWSVTGPAGRTTVSTPTGHAYPGTGPPLLGYPTEAAAPEPVPYERVPDEKISDERPSDETVPRQPVAGEPVASGLELPEPVPRQSLPRQPAPGASGSMAERAFEVALAA